VVRGAVQPTIPSSRDNPTAIQAEQLTIPQGGFSMPGACAGPARGKRIGAVAFYWRTWPEQKDYWVGLTLGGRMFVNHGPYLRSALEAVGYAAAETSAV